MVPIDEALQIIGETWPSNCDSLDDLKERLTGAQAIPLMPFVGAGLSVPMGFPSWGDFLKGLAAECGKSVEVAALLADGKYEEAAETLERGLGSAIFNRRVAHTFGERKSKDCALKGPVLALPDLAGGAVVTTNFDRVLERVFAEAGSPFEHVGWGSQVDSIRLTIADNRPFLLKLHGDAEEGSGRVLTRREYETHYTAGDPEGLRAQLGRVFQGRTLLFVGCSLGKDRTMDVLTEVLRQAAGLLHFAILEKPASDEDFFAKQRLLGERGILPIWYPSGRHELIEPLLRWIASLQPFARVAGPDLALERPSQRKKEIRSELDLLIPYRRTTELVGRELELESLRTWVRSEAPISARVIIGGGGSGKTRLAVELLEWIEGAEHGQWNCGFLTQAELERFSGLQNLSQWQRRKPVLAVVDDAAGSAEKLRMWLEQLAAAMDGREKLRLLLLEREANLDAGWLSSLISRGDSAAAVRGLFDPAEPVRLESVAETADRRSVLRMTMEAGAAWRGVAAPALPVAGVDSVFDGRIEEPMWGDPLNLMIAGLTALDTGLPAAMALGRADLAFRLADRERERVERFGHGSPSGLMGHMAAYVTASGGLSHAELREAAKAESEAVGLAHPGGWRALADAVGEGLRGGDGATAVKPDVVGEALLLLVWGGAEVAEGCRAVLRAAQVRRPQVVASVVRSAQDFCVGKTPRLEPLAWLDALVAEAKGDITKLRAIEGQLPYQTLVLRERALEVDTTLAAALRKQADKDEAARWELVRVLNNLSVRLSALGRREEALRAAEEAVRLYRQLAAQRPDVFLPDLAGALNGLGFILSTLGRREEALEATDAATRLYQQLAAQRPDAFLPGLAMSLTNLGNGLSALGRREEALQTADEAAQLYRQLAAQRPDAFLPDLAMSLNNLGNRLSDLGRREEALQAANEAAGLYRQLAAQRPDAFLPDLAMSLNNLGNRLSDLGRREEALQPTEEAVRIRRQLAAQLPDAFLPDLAGSLNSLGNRLSVLRRHEDALKATEDAVRLYRQLAAQRADAFLPDLASSLNNLGNRLSALGRHEEALRAAEDAVRIRRQLAAQRPDAFLPNLASSLNNLGGRLSAVGRHEEALLAADEAVRLYRQLAAQRPNAFLPDLATSLGAKAAILANNENPAAAADALREGVEGLKPLFLRQPGALKPLMGNLVGDYIRACGAAGIEVDSGLLGDVLPRLADDQAGAAEA
jgi:tetratricopeptide (TPR) repeat protein